MVHRWLDIDDVPRAVILDLNAQTRAKKDLRPLAPPLTDQEREALAGVNRMPRGDN